MWLKKGGTIFDSRPYAAVVYPQYREAVCHHCCSAPPSPGLDCGECQAAAYCSRRCLQAAAATHALECALLEGAGEPAHPTATLLLRVWLRWSAERRGDWGPFHEGEEGELVPGRTVPRRFSDFMAHEEDIRRSSRMMRHITKHYEALEAVLLDDMPNFQEFVQIYGMVVINDFELTQSSGELEGHSLGMAVYLAPSIVDHSCRPNADVEFLGSRLVMRSLVDRREKDVSNVFFSYIDEQEDQKRREYLKKFFFFDCQCDKCLENINI